MSGLTKFFDGMHGVIFPFAGSTAPTGFLLCYGQAVSRTTYAALFATIGTTFGAGDGSTTFNVPDLRGRTLADKDDMGGSAASRLTTAAGGVDGATLGASGGAQTHTLTAAQLPAHSHTYKASSTAATGSGAAEANDAGGITKNTTSSGGSGDAHPNVQPTLVLNYIIKT